MSNSTLSSAASGSLIYRNYNNFRGVDFSNRKDEVSIYRSPDALNVWKNYKSSNGNCIETRPDVEELKEYEDSIYGVYFFNSKKIVHSGTKLYNEDEVIYDKMSEHESNFFIYERTLYIKDGTQYLMYDGEIVEEVAGYVPTTTISKAPSGEGNTYEDVNLLTGMRKNQFCSDGESTEYFLDVEEFDDDYIPIVSIDGRIIESSEYTYVPDKGKILFNNPPEKPLTDGQDNVVVQFKKTIAGNRDKIDKCTLIEVFDNRVFFAGNPDYPNMLWHCSLNDPTYCSDTDYYTEGVDDANIKALVAGNNALWVMKEPGQTNTTIFYHNPTIDDESGKLYPSIHSSIGIGCVSTGINFNDDICFFSERGMESISGDVTTEQAIAHRSTLVDNKLLNEENYANMKLAEWEGYLLIIIDNKIYLANSRDVWTNNDHIEYEWFYWELENIITCTLVRNGVLYLCVDKKIYTLTDTSETRKVEAYFTTLADEINYPQMWKTTNKKATVIDVECTKMKLEVRTDNNKFTTIGTFNSSSKGYIKPRIKAKKFKEVQLKFSSTVPFSLYSCTLEAYLGNVVKR